MKYYSAIVAVMLLLMAAPFALAANGDGRVDAYKPNVVSTSTPVTLNIKFTNNATDDTCLDELIITPPDTWGGTAHLDSYDRGAVQSATNEADLNCKAQQSDLQSMRIIPVLPICRGETVNIQISGLTAPSAYEVSKIKIFTSDQHGGTCTRLENSGLKVYVTSATKLKLEYFHITEFANAGFKGTATGASAKLNQLYVNGTAAATIQVEILTNAGYFTIYPTTALTGGFDTLSMSYVGWDPLTRDTTVLKSGYINDGATVQYRITYSGGAGTLQLKGEKEDIRNDPDWSTSGLTAAIGTIITAGGSEQRKINVQLTDGNGYDINEKIPLEIKTDLGSIVELKPYETDSDGNKYFTLNPGCTYGIAHVNVSTDPLAVTPWVVENVGIDSSIPASFAVVKGDGANVGAGESQLIEVGVYDSCGNLVSNTHVQQVDFDYMTTNCPDVNHMNKLAQTPGGPSNDHEYGDTYMGVADVYLKTDCQLCTHDVKITAAGLPGSPKTIHLTGVNGKPAKMVVTADQHKITADQCVTATIQVTDKCGNLVSQIPSEVGNEMEQWESIVRVNITNPLVVDQPGWASSSQTYISSADFREKEFADSYVQGKLNNGVGHVTICGCQGLGTYDIIASSDTIESGKDTVEVNNAAADCIETTTVNQLKLCDSQAQIDMAIKDKCGNYWRNQQCGTGQATYCVDLGLSGSCMPNGASLSTNTVCIDVGQNGGKLEVPVTLFRNTSECCELDITATKGNTCCQDFPSLRQCDEPKVLFHGAPDHMETKFFKTRKTCEPGCPVGIQCSDEVDIKGNPVKCYEQIEGEITNPASEVVSEEVLDLFTVVDKCGHIVKDYTGTVDVEVKGQDTASIYQVDHTVNTEEVSWCSGTYNLCKGVTNKDSCKSISGCSWNNNKCNGKDLSCTGFNADQCKEKDNIGCDWNTGCNIKDPAIIKKLVIHNTKPATEKQWLPIEKNDIVVDKLAFSVNHEVDPAGLWLDVYVESEKTPGFQPSEDQLVGKAPVVNFNGPTIMELKDSDFSNARDNQREGGVLITAGDSKDFYVILRNTNGALSCGAYNATFLWFQDYNSPDLTNSGSGYPFLGSPSGIVEDGCINSDNFNWIDSGHAGPATCPLNGGGTKDSRNDDYQSSTPDYGFGDRYLYGLTFSGGQAWIKFRDLVAEDVKVITSHVVQSGVCSYSGNLPVIPNPENITFVEQPATQIKLINHDAGAEGKTVVCGGDEMDPASNAYSLNIQTTDGFDNPHAKEVQIDLEYCLKMPFGRWMGEDKLTDEYLGSDQCFTKAQLKEMIKNSEMGQYMGDVLFGDFFGTEFSAWVDKYFEEAKVEFWDSTQHKLPYDASGHQYVMTDSNGQAQVYVTSQKAGFYKIVARPLALDAASTFVEFDAGIPSKLDMVALPSFGIPADGEQEAMLLLRALDKCGNIVDDVVNGVTVSVTQGKQVYISQDFEGKNNYDGDVTGTVSGFGWTKLAVLSDLPQTATLTATQTSLGLDSDSTQIQFQGAPVKLKITEITPSDRLPADGETGAWVTVEIQDVNGNRVTGYHGNGYSGDPGDPWGCMNYEFKDICLDLDALDGSFKAIDANDQYTYGWTNLHSEDHGKICGDLMFGKGKVYVTYGHEGCTTSAKVKVTVFDEGKNGQEYNENGIPVSVKTTTLTPDSGEINFVQPATQWNIWSDKTIALADGKSTVTLSVQVENPFMDIRQAVDGTVYVGGVAESGAKITWEGQIDSLNPTKANIVTDPVTGKAYLTLTSTKAGKAEITITGGKAYVCEIKKNDGYVCPTCETIYDMYECHYNKDVSLTPKTIEVEFLEVASKDIYLEKGWNFISVPYELNTSKDQIGEIFNTSNIVVAYGWNCAGTSWVTLNSSSQLKPLEGYWIKVKAPEVITMVYAKPQFPSIPTKQICSGWNTVGLTWDSPIKMKNGLMSIDKIYSNVIGWISSLQQYALPVANTEGTSSFETGGVNMQPKEGYWVWSTNPGTLAGVAAQGAS